MISNFEYYQEDKKIFSQKIKSKLLLTEKSSKKTKSRLFSFWNTKHRPQLSQKNKIESTFVSKKKSRVLST